MKDQVVAAKEPKLKRAQALGHHVLGVIAIHDDPAQHEQGILGVYLGEAVVAGFIEEEHLHDEEATGYRGKNYLPSDFDYSRFDRIPYLNGGLFDVLQEDNASDTIDDAKISVPNRLFYATDADELKVTVAKKLRPVVGLNTLLGRYKFTIAENTPHEEEIALDPELLGLVFENLLAEVDSSDPAAAESARKASGSYYTPRRIIDYMVNESLRLHLENFIRPRGANADEIKALAALLYHSNWDRVRHPRLAAWVVESFDQLRLLDPACGSGAFPMGALLRMVEVLRVVDPGNQLWLDRQIARLPKTPTVPS